VKCPHFILFVFENWGDIIVWITNNRQLLGHKGQKCCILRICLVLCKFFVFEVLVGKKIFKVTTILTFFLERRGSVVCIVARLWAGQLTSHDPVPDGVNRLFVSEASKLWGPPSLMFSAYGK
jgi:hypothetical protein